jgi:hypothetical protein
MSEPMRYWKIGVCAYPARNGWKQKALKLFSCLRLALLSESA